MSAAPLQIGVKRRRTEEPLQALLLQEHGHQAKRQLIQYRLHNASLQHHSTADASAPASAPAPATPRHFQLERKALKRSAGAAGLATFAEKRARSERDCSVTAVRAGAEDDGQPSGTSTPLKRPGANAEEMRWRAENWTATPERRTQGTPVAETAETAGLADALHEFALSEAARDEAEQRANEKPRVKYQPKRPVRRLRDRQPTNPSQPEPQIRDPDTDMHMETSDDEDFVYDVYVRYQQPLAAASADTAVPANKAIGYLIITEQDEPLWETYLEDEEDERDGDSEDEDENAENFYGADYPEDEVASDDQLGKGAYGYRHGGSEDEQWDSDTGAWSDEAEGDEMRNPWKRFPWQHEQGVASGVASDDEES